MTDTWRVVPGEIGPEAQHATCGNTHILTGGGIAVAASQHECPAPPCKRGRDAGLCDAHEAHFPMRDDVCDALLVLSVEEEGRLACLQRRLDILRTRTAPGGSSSKPDPQEASALAWAIDQIREWRA